MSNDRTTDTTALVARLRRHEDGLRQQCSCRSREANCAACDCGLAADEIDRLREALGWFLSDPRFQVAVGGNPNVVDRMLTEARERLS